MAHRFAWVTAGMAALWAGVCGAQPVAIDLGRFDNVASRSVTVSTVVVNAANPVRWYRLEVPRIANPGRYLDIWTQFVIEEDTEIALYDSDGTFLRTDDDDGASRHSALSFGITNPNAPDRQDPGVFAGQNDPEPNDGRDGTISGPTPAGPTVAIYYIAVTQYPAAFSNNFQVVRQGGDPNLVTSLVVRMNTPGGQISPTVSGQDVTLSLGDVFALTATTTGTATQVQADFGAAGAGPPFTFSPLPANLWSLLATVNTLGSPGVYPGFYRASNTLGDVGFDVRFITVRPPAWQCSLAGRRIIDPNPGTSLYTYTTTLANIDGPWAGCSPFSPSGEDVWFSFTPSVSGQLTLSTCNIDTGVTGPQPDTLLGIRRQCTQPTFFACTDNSPGCVLGSRLANIPVVANEVYNIAVRAYSGAIVDGTLAVTFGLACDSVDFNRDSFSPDSADLDDFLAVLSGGPSACSTFPTPGCNDIDFNNDGFSPDSLDLDAFLSRLAGGPCL